MPTMQGGKELTTLVTLFGVIVKNDKWTKSDWKKNHEVVIKKISERLKQLEEKHNKSRHK